MIFLYFYFFSVPSIRCYLIIGIIIWFMKYKYYKTIKTLALLFYSTWLSFLWKWRFMPTSYGARLCLFFFNMAICFSSLPLPFFTLKIYNYQGVNEDYNVVNTPAPSGMLFKFPSVPLKMFILWCKVCFLYSLCLL